MATTYKLLDSATLTGNANWIEFTSIDQTYTDLLVYACLRSNRSALNDQGDIKLNGTSITGRRVYGDGSGAGSDTDSYTIPPANNATSSVFGSDLIYIPNYASTSTYKSVSVDGTMENNGTNSYAYLVAGLYSSNTAVSSFRITCVNASWVTGSSIYLYGIKNS